MRKESEHDMANISINCFCKPCILTEAKKFENMKMYKEARQVLYEATHYYSQIAKELDEEILKFNLRVKQSCPSLQLPSSPPKRLFRSDGSNVGTNSFHQPFSSVCGSSMTYHNIINEKSKPGSLFTCPVAVFENEPNPSQLPMYPKNLVYVNGQDIQLEEIRAAMYWEKIKKKESEKSASDKTKEKIKPEINSGIPLTTLYKSNIAVQRIQVLQKSEPAKNIRMEIAVNQSASQQTEIMAKKSINTVSPSENFKLVSEELCPNFIPSVPKIETLKTDSKGDNEEKQLSPTEIKTVFAIPSNENKPVKESTSNVVQCVDGSSEYSTGACKTVILHPHANVAEKQKISTTQCNQNVKMTAVPADVPINHCAEQRNHQSDHLHVEKKEQKFIDTTYVCSSIPKTSLKLQNTYIIERESESSNKAVNRSTIEDPSATVSKQIESKNCHTANVPVKFPKQSTYLDDISKMLDSSGFNNHGSAANEKDAVINEHIHDDNKENVLPPGAIPLWDEDEEDMTCNTKAFALILPSSTPNRRKSQCYGNSPPVEPECSINRPRQSIASATVPNLSMILELSKERSSSSSGAASVSSAVNVMNSKTSTRDKQSLSTIAEIKEKSNELSSKFDISDPFDPELLNSLLEKMQFPCEEHRSNYHLIDAPVMKLASSVKLGFEKYTIVGEIGKGNYARILKAHKTQKPSKQVTLKLQKPACVWEYYISKEIRNRLKSTNKNQFFLHYSDIFVFKNGSILLSEWAPFGSLLNFINTLKSGNYCKEKCPVIVSTHISIQITAAIEYLHSCQIIHGDVKPDNFIISNVTSDGKPCIQMIDYGRSIDMTLFPKNTVFHKVITTEDFTCNEMRDNKPWTYQTDLFGLAGTFYVLLVGEYMKTVKRSDGVWVLKKSLPRYMHKNLWDPIFNELLNIPSCSELPDLSLLKGQLQIFYDSFDKFTVNQQFNRILPLYKK